MASNFYSTNVRYVKLGIYAYSIYKIYILKSVSAKEYILQSAR
jgi:hypothetical protein